MYACGYPTVPPKKYRLSTFFRENIVGDLFKSFYISLGTTISCICVLKNQRFSSSVPFNVT